MKKSLLALLLTALIAFCTAVGCEEVCPFIHCGDVGVPIRQLMQLVDDRVSVPSKPRIDGNEAEPFFDEYCADVLKSWQNQHGIKPTGVFDVDTMRALADVDADDHLAWLPMHGGKKYHSDKTCSGMIEPRLISVSLAYDLGYTACKRCGGKPWPIVKNCKEKINSTDNEKIDEKSVSP